MKRPERASLALERLTRGYPDPECALNHRNVFELLIATILSAQCTDERVNLTTPALFKRFPTPKRMAAGSTEEIEDLIRSTGFFRNKTKSIIGASHRITEEFGGKVPSTMEELLGLPGVARKTANVVLGNAFGINEGVVVDTHVQRLSGLIGLTRQTTPEKIEKDLMKLFPREEWTDLSHRLILHGRAVCIARRPRCLECVLGPDVCRSWDPVPEHWKGKAAKASAKKKTAAKKPVSGKRPVTSKRTAGKR